MKVRLKKATSNFRDCLFLDNFSPNFFGPIMAEDQGAVRLQVRPCLRGNPASPLLAAASVQLYHSEKTSELQSAA